MFNHGSEAAQEEMTKADLVSSNQGAAAEAASWDAPALVTEWGYGPSDPNAERFFTWQSELQEQYQLSSFLWLWKELSSGDWGCFDHDAATGAFTERPAMKKALARVRPAAVAGWPLAYGFDRATGRFSLKFQSDPAVDALHLVAVAPVLGAPTSVTCDGVAAPAAPVDAWGTLGIACGLADGQVHTLEVQRGAAPVEPLTAGACSGLRVLPDGRYPIPMSRTSNVPAATEPTLSRPQAIDQAARARVLASLRPIDRRFVLGEATLAELSAALPPEIIDDLPRSRIAREAASYGRALRTLVELALTAEEYAAEINDPRMSLADMVRGGLFDEGDDHDVEWTAEERARIDALGPVPDWHHEVLAERLAAAERGEGSSHPWDEVRKDFLAKLREVCDPGGR